MAACAELNPSNQVVINTTPIESCTGYVMYTASEWQANSFYSIPASSDFAAAWGAGFIFPMAIFVVAQAVAQIVNFWRH